MEEMLVDGYAEPGSYVRSIVYDTLKEEIDEIVARALNCEQYIKYTCFQSKLLSDAGNLKCLFVHQRSAYFVDQLH